MLEHLDDIESDMSVFHRVDDIYKMEGPRFFRMAFRLAAYSGVMAARLQAEHDKPSHTTAPVNTPPAAKKYMQQHQRTQVDDVRMANRVGNDPLFDIG